MDIDLSTLSAARIYHTLIQCIVPRPIAWVLSENNNQSINLAPFSYFNGVSSDPPLLMFVVGKKPDGSLKDTRTNILQRKDFVLHIPDAGLVTEVNQSSASLAAGVSEVEQLALETVPMNGSRLPRIRRAKIAMACAVQQVVDVSESQAMIIGRIQSMYLDSNLMVETNGRQRVAIDRLNPLCRLGGNDYATLDMNNIMTIARPS